MTHNRQTYEGYEPVSTQRSSRPLTPVSRFEAHPAAQHLMETDPFSPAYVSADTDSPPASSFGRRTPTAGNTAPEKPSRDSVRNFVSGLRAFSLRARRTKLDPTTDSLDGSRLARSTTAPLSRPRHSRIDTARDTETLSQPNHPTPHVLHLSVKPFVLEGNGTALYQNPALSRWLKRPQPMKRVSVDANYASLAPTCLYASDLMIHSPLEEPYKQTEFITKRPLYVDKSSLVYQDSPFEISIIGMSVAADHLSQPGEILLYSLQSEPGFSEDNDSLPYVHYDPTKDDKQPGFTADQFISIPASKSLFLASNGSVDGMRDRTSVNCRFKVLQLNKVDKTMQMSLSGIEQLAQHVSQFSVSAPLLGLLSPALSLASSVTKRTLESYAKPDRVIVTDMNFLLAERERESEQDDDRDQSDIPFERRTGEYLRFGYYFFLDRRVDAKLYASFRTFPNVPLMLRRSEETLPPNEKRFFPLTGVSYLVVRVTPRTSNTRPTRKPIRISHVQRLENLMRTSLASEQGCEESENLVKTLADLAKDLGISAGCGGQQGGTRASCGG